MKPSKVLKEYIERKVREAYGKKSEVELEYEQARKDFEEEVAKANQKVKEYMEQVAKEIPNPHNFSLTTSTSYAYSTWRYGGETPQIQKNKEQAEKERTEKINKTIEDILIELELGGTKAQLEERLANL